MTLVIEVSKAMLEIDPIVRPNASILLKHRLFQNESKLFEDSDEGKTTSASPVHKTIEAKQLKSIK